MKFKAILFLLYLFSFMPGQGTPVWQDFDKPAFYNVVASGNVDKVNAELILIEASSIREKEAYAGVLLMKKAGLVSKPAEKLKLFKAGRIRLETSLARDSTNGEYHFLRLIIQEHAPKIVKYSADLEKDSKIIHHTFKGLTPAAKQAIIDYSQHSKVLRPEDF